MLRFLTENGRKALAILTVIAAVSLIGVASRFVTDPPTGVIVPVTVDVPTSIVQPAGTRLKINGIEVEAPAGEPVVIDITKTGPALSNESSGTSTSAGITTPSGDAAGQFNASAGTPSLPSIWGGPLSFTTPGGSALSFEFSAGVGLYGFAGFGVLFVIGAVALWYFTRNLVLAACVAGIGVLCISIGVAPELWGWFGLGIGVLGSGWLGIHLWRARAASKTAEELTEYDELSADMLAVLTPEQVKNLKATLSAARRVLFDRLIKEAGA